jgi:hypothetical protein
MLEDALSLLESHLKGNPLVVTYHKQIVSLLGNAKEYERYQHSRVLSRLSYISYRIISHHEKYKKFFKDIEPKWWISFDKVWHTIGPYVIVIHF